jgi:hypothetical protein
VQARRLVSKQEIRKSFVFILISYTSITSNFTEEKLWSRGRIITRILDSLNIGSISVSLMYLLL